MIPAEIVKISATARERSFGKALMFIIPFELEPIVELHLRDWVCSDVLIRLAATGVLRDDDARPVSKTSPERRIGRSWISAAPTVP